MLTVARWQSQTAHVSEIEIYMNVPRHLMTSFEVLENGCKAILETDMAITGGVCVEMSVSVTNRKLLKTKVLILREVNYIMNAKC